ncbi:MAG: tRNA (adenosine(37)-N6)-threonylcarbamoyltransferase complex dimerization subunit type 1 TsaB [Alphaproteobacteria bacterium]|nr:tRNA (adenosine(37)-N6)-threonylcarbamoyltransferase complex dimerization subunit type 1 TsaB [Alphaproteobacteria bacterium]
MILAIDTAFGPIGVALMSDAGEIVAHEAVLNTLGAQAEKLPPLVASMIAGAGLKPGALRRIAVTTGPGAFTGVRVGLAFAKGMALALKVPLLGFTTLECLIAQARAARPGASCAAVIDARRGELYAQGSDDAFAPAVMGADDVREQLGRMSRPLVLAGSGAAVVAPDDAEMLDIQTVDVRELARLALRAEPAAHPPVPCYLRAPDARLPS